jgi:hypothetical protein
MAEQLCRFCDNPATGRCEECGRFYCAEHGEVVCASCGDPSRGVPGAVLFRGTLLALVVGVVVAVVLIVNQPRTESEDDSPPETATAQATETPAGSPTSGGATATATPTPETYTVQFGDTLTGIAARFGVPLDELIEANNITDPNNVVPGTVLIIP